MTIDAYPSTTTPAPVNTSASSPDRRISILRIAIWLGFAAWFGELASHLIRKYAFHILHYLAPAIILLGPIAYFIIFVSIGAALTLLHRLAPRVMTQRAAVTILTILASVSVVAVYTKWIGTIAVLVLALGIGIQAARLINGHMAGFQRLMRRTGWVMACVAALLAIGASSYDYIRERRSLSGLADARRGSPNVIMIILDTVRSASLSLYGYERPTTPELERWAKTGTRFDYAMSTSSWTVPGHAGFFTAELPTELGTEYDRPVNTKHATLAEVLRDNGYETAGFVANIYYLSREFRLDRGFGRYEVHPISFGQLILSSSLGRAVTNSPWYRSVTGQTSILNGKNAERINRDFLNWLDDRKTPTRPFFAFMNYYDAHEPYLPPEPFRSRFALPGPEPKYRYVTNTAERESDKFVPQAQIPPQIGQYDGALAYLDYELGRLFRELDRRGLTENTLVIVTSDHGEEFGEHDVMGHAKNVYLQAIHVPLVISFPGSVPAGVSVEDPVSLRDVPATVLDLVGLDGRSDFAGKSLTARWREPRDTSADAIFSALLAVGKPKSLLQGRYHYIRRQHKEELYDWLGDRREQIDLASKPESAPALERFRVLFKEVPGISEKLWWTGDGK